MYEYLDGLNTLIEGSKDGKKKHIPKKKQQLHIDFQKYKVFKSTRFSKENIQLQFTL